SAADACALDDRHVAKDAEVEPAVAVLGMLGIEDPWVVGLAWKIRRIPPPAALEHEDAVAALGQPARRDRAAEPASDDDRVEVEHVLLRCLNRLYGVRLHGVMWRRLLGGPPRALKRGPPDARKRPKSCRRTSRRSGSYRQAAPRSTAPRCETR